MNNEIKTEIKGMIERLNDELELNRDVVKCIEKLDTTIIDLKLEMDSSREKMKEMLELFKVEQFTNNLDDSLKNIVKTNDILLNIKKTMNEMDAAKEKFDRYNKDLKDQYNKLLLSNKEKKEIIDSLDSLSENTKEISKNTKKNSLILENISDEIENCKKEISKSKKEILKQVNGSGNGFDKPASTEGMVVAIPDERNLLKRIDNLEEDLILAIENKADLILSNGNVENKNKSTEVKIDDVKLVNKINDNTEEYMYMVNSRIEESNEKIIKSQDEIKEQIKTLETNLTFTIEHKTEEIINNKVNSILKKILSGIAE